MKKKRKKRRKVRIGRLVTLLVLTVLIGLLCAQGIYYLIPKGNNDVFVVALDAAFDIDQPGLQGKISEYEYNEKVISALEALLQEDGTIEAVRTHGADQPSSVEMRAQKINDLRPDIVLSVRCYNNDGEHSGMEIYVDPATAKEHAKSLAFASILNQKFEDSQMHYYYYRDIGRGKYQEHLADVEDTTDYGEETFALMEKSEVPVVITAALNVDAEDAETMIQDENILAAAQKYYEAIREYVNN